MNSIEKLKAKLVKYPCICYVEKADRLLIPCTSNEGFEIAFIQDAEEITICFGNWHGHFETDDEAIDFVTFGLSNNCRLREIKRGGQAYKWIVEAKDKDDWKLVYLTGFLCFQFWKKKEESIYQNQVLIAN